MKIDTSNITYHRFPNALDVSGNGKADRKKASSSAIEREEKKQSVRSQEVDSPTNPSNKNSVYTSSISRILSPEEKKMLNVLFPPPGRNFGIRAYRGSQKSVQVEAVKGRQIDMTT